ncbi:PEP-CTERM sorting domain-containing protein [Pseudoduganella albidiflava]|nr:PEP-CTERM sorting domain-containing protein [Pseudoduganella albidiflava]GGY24095.1 hypothetical protein GCM10007387_02010 [Pseudoduganella albidiflava]
MNRYLSTAAALACTSLLCSHAAAAVHTTASSAFANVQFGVIDLTPDDGVAAGYQFGPRSTEFEASFTNGDHHDFDRFDPALPVPVNAQASYYGYWASATTNGQLGNLQTAVDTGSLQRHGDGAYGSAWQNVSILLKAHSAFTVAGRADASVQTSDPALPILPGRASFGVFLNYVSLDQPHQSFFHHLELGNGASSLSYGDTFSLIARNDLDHDIALNLSFSSYAAAWANVLAVPEPTTYLMLGAGLLVLGARRRLAQRAG